MLWFLSSEVIAMAAGGAGGDPMPKTATKTSAKT
jgi:hypothetical protein